VEVFANPVTCVMNFKYWFPIQTYSDVWLTGPGGIPLGKFYTLKLYLRVISTVYLTISLTVEIG